MKLNNKYYILRHGEAISNVKDIVSSWPEKFENPLTEKGKIQVEKIVTRLKENNIDLIFSSDILRAKQTAEILGEKLKIIPEYDKRLREIDFGIFNTKTADEFTDYFKDPKERIQGRVPGGESYEDISKRMGDFLKDTETNYQNKNILIVSHQAPLFVFEAIILGISLQRAVNYFTEKKLLSNCELRKVMSADKNI